MNDSMMTAIAFAICAFLAFCFYRGHRKLKGMEESVESPDEERDGHRNAWNLTCHGGFPPIPRPGRINLRLSRDGMTLHSQEGQSGAISFADVRKVERFSTLRKPGKRQSMFFWAPIALLFVKEGITHFLAIQYKDIDGDINHLILEAADLQHLDTLHEQVGNLWDESKYFHMGSELRKLGTT